MYKEKAVRVKGCVKYCERTPLVGPTVNGSRGGLCQLYGQVPASYLMSEPQFPQIDGHSQERTYTHSLKLCRGLLENPGCPSYPSHILVAWLWSFPVAAVYTSSTNAHQR